MRQFLFAATTLAILAGPAAAQTVVIDRSGPSAGPVVAVVPAVRDYVVANPTPPVVLEGRLVEGTVVPATVDLAPVPGNSDYRYFYTADNQPVIVRSADRQVVFLDSDTDLATTASVAAPYPDEVVAYVRNHPVEGLVLEGRIENGMVVPTDTQLAPVEGYEDYSYFYQNGRPYIVSNADRRVVYLPN